MNYAFALSAMLRITLDDRPRLLTFKLEGQLAGAWVAELRQCWKRALADRGHRRLVIDLTNVTFVDPEGVRLLESIHGERVRFVSSGPMMRALVEKISRGQ